MTADLKLKNTKILLLIILFGTLLRMFNITQPLLEGGSVRQIQTAMIARNFYNHGYRLFYPKAEGSGREFFYLMQEFYIIPFIAAIFYKLLGGPQEWVLRMISVFSYVLTTIVLYKLGRYYFSRKVGLISAFCFTISPLSIYLGRAVHPEMLMTFFNLSTIYLFSRWVYEDKPYYGLSSIFCFVMAVLLKVPNLYLLLPLTFILYTKYGLKAFWNFKFYFFTLSSFVPIILFNYFEYLVRITFPNPAMEFFKLTAMFRYIKFFLRQKIFYKKVLDDLLTYTLAPIGVSLFIIGLLMKIREKKEYLFYIWLLGVVVFFLLMPAQAMQGYYQIHILPIACIFIAKLTNSFLNSDLYINVFRKKTLTFGFMALVFVLSLRYSYAYYFVPPHLRYVVEAAGDVRLLTKVDSLVVIGMENGIGLMYYTNRPGWGLDINLENKRQNHIARGDDISNRIYDPIISLEKYRSQGASYFVSASLEEFFSHRRFPNYMFDNYRVIKRTPNYIIFDLNAASDREKK